MANPKFVWQIMSKNGEIWQAKISANFCSNINKFGIFIFVIVKYI